MTYLLTDWPTERKRFFFPLKIGSAKVQDKKFCVIFEHSQLFLQNQKKIWFQVWNFDFLILQKLRMFQNSEKLFILNFIWANFQREKKPFLRSVGHYHGFVAVVQVRGVVASGTARARLAVFHPLSFFLFSPFLSLSFFLYFEQNQRNVFTRSLSHY